MPRVGYTPRPTDTYSFLPLPMRGADHLPTQQVRWWWFLGMAFLLKTFLGDGTFLEEKICSHTLQMQLLPNQVLSMADEREERGGEKKI